MFRSLIYQNFRLNGKFPIQFYRNQPYFKLIKYFFIHKNKILGEKMYILRFFQFFQKLLPKFGDFINSTDCIGKIT